MPVITFEAGNLTKEQKQQVAKDFTDAAVKATGLPAGAFYVFIKENEPENVAVGGTLLADK